jgi:O-antigen/teichoic acid export membrane protein
MSVVNKFINKYKNMSKPTKASIWFVVCYVIQRGLQFLSMPIYTRIMSQEDYGVYSVFLSWFNIICVFTSLNIYSGVFNKAMIKYAESREKYMSSIQMLTTLITAIFALFVFIFHDTLIKLTGFSLNLLVLMILHLIMFPTLQYWSQEQRFRFKYWSMLIMTVINSIVSVLIGVVFVLISNNKSTALIAASVIVQAIICLFLYISIAYKGKCFFHKEYWKWSIGLALPLIPHYLSEILLGHFDRLIINHMCGSAKAGIYNLVYQISMVMTIIRTGINGAFAPWLYNAIKNQKYDDIKNVTKILTIMMGIMSFSLMIIGSEILKIAAPKSYYEAVVDIPSIMVGCFYIFVYTMFVYIEIYYEEKYYILIASVASAAFNVVLNIILIPKFGYLVAGYTTMLSYGLMAILHLVFLFQVAKKHPEIYMMFDLKIIGILSGILLAITFPMIILYKYVFIRYLVVLLILVFIVIKRKFIMSTIKKIKNKDNMKGS